MRFSPDNKICKENLENDEANSEKGLREFRIYRVAPNNKLLHLQPASSQKDFGALGEILNRAIFFTTQKNLALEYRFERQSKPVLLEQRGLDFLADLRKLADQKIKLAILSHRDLLAFQKIFTSKNFNKKEANAFFANRTYSPLTVSPRMLRRSAEIIVIMPENLNVLPLTIGNIKKQAIKAIQEKGRHQDKVEFKLPGLFHAKLAQINETADSELKSLKRKMKKLEKERSEIFGAMIKKTTENEKAGKQLLLQELELEIREIKEKILVRNKKQQGSSFFRKIK